MTTESKALRGIFFGQTALKKNKYGEPSRPPKTISVLGAGLMGAGIAQVSAVQGKYDVIVKDKDSKGLFRGVGQIYGNLSGRVKKKAMSSFDRDKIMSNIRGLTDDSPMWKEHMSKTDLLVEAVFEDLGVKHKVIEEMEQILPAHAIIATNTSAIPIGDIAKGSKRPERVVGMHYFSPVDKMPLLEIIPHAGTDTDVLAAAVQVGLKQGKTVISVKDVPGFYINRCLGPFLAEVMALTLSGVDLLTMDKAMTSWGMPVGPITLADEVGVDVANHLQYNLKELGVRMATGSDQNLMQEVVDKGFLGKKTGKGFYLHDGKNKKGPKVVNPEIEKRLKEVVKQPTEKISVEEMQERVSHRLINEAIMCLQDGIIANPVDGDMGMVFGIGFPPFKGGPFRLIDTTGAQKFVDTMNRYQEKHGEQFAPAQLIVDMAKEGKKFHP
jgi:enoyl-CoA hydratase/long-chain 3-hydroxyacyl-CoA dehydrogenase